jgi:hypothetical protein
LSTWWHQDYHCPLRQTLVRRTNKKCIIVQEGCQVFDHGEWDETAFFGKGRGRKEDIGKCVQQVGNITVTAAVAGSDTNPPPPKIMDMTVGGERPNKTEGLEPEGLSDDDRSQRSCGRKRVSGLLGLTITGTTNNKLASDLSSNGSSAAPADDDDDVPVQAYKPVRSWAHWEQKMRTQVDEIISEDVYPWVKFVTKTAEFEDSTFMNRIFEKLGRKNDPAFIAKYWDTIADRTKQRIGDLRNLAVRETKSRVECK